MTSIHSSLERAKLAVGIIGAGSIVEDSHLPALKVCNLASVAWVHDANERRATMLAAMYGIRPVAVDRLPAALDDVDVCLLAVPYGARPDFIEMCASRGKALYVEKPFATTLQEHERYCSLFPTHKLAVGFQRRYYAIVETLASIIASGAFGRLLRIDFTQGHFHLKGGGGYLSSAAMAGGGVTIESAIHGLDQILLFTGAGDVRVGDTKILHKDGIDYDTLFDSELTTSSGTVAVRCEISSLRNLGTRLELHFEHANIQCGLSPDATVGVSGNDPDTTFLLRKANGGVPTVGSAFHRFWSDFLKAVATGEENRTLAVTSRLTTAWIEQVYRRMRAH